jgi:hypothetical protein
VSEWLRRWTRNPLGSARRGSNPLGVVLLSLATRPAHGNHASESASESHDDTAHVNMSLVGLQSECSDAMKSAARLAQSAERKALNFVVVGSSPTVGDCI